jgi:lysophospholipase L1-like esterase
MIDRSVTTPYVISLFPTRGPDGYLNDAIKELNQRVDDYCIRNRIEFINVYSALVKYGELNKEFSSDGTHLNSKGYGILKDSIKKYLN